MALSRGHQRYLSLGLGAAAQLRLSNGIWCVDDSLPLRESQTGLDNSLAAKRATRASSSTSTARLNQTVCSRSQASLRLAARVPAGKPAPTRQQPEATQLVRS